MSDDQQVSAPEQVVVRITTIGELTKPASAGFTIPNYQRGFAWEKKEVEAFIESIKDVNTPFLGNFIIHEEAKDGSLTYNLVDGQQRMTCILMALGQTGLLHLDEGHQFSDSIKLLCEANNIITKSISQTDQATLRNKKIQLTIVNDIDLAFTFYDNANTAGQPLQAKDIIKSRHLLAMSQHGQAHLMVEAAQIWKEMEKKVGGKDLFSDFLFILYSIRNWRRGQKTDWVWHNDRPNFDKLQKELIDEFAGKKNIRKISFEKNQTEALSFYGTLMAKLEGGWFTIKYLAHHYNNYKNIITSKGLMSSWLKVERGVDAYSRFYQLYVLDWYTMAAGLLLEDLYPVDLIMYKEKYETIRKVVSTLACYHNSPQLLNKGVGGITLIEMFQTLGTPEFDKIDKDLLFAGNQTDGGSRKIKATEFIKRYWPKS